PRRDRFDILDVHQRFVGTAPAALESVRAGRRDPHNHRLIDLRTGWRGRQGERQEGAGGHETLAKNPCGSHRLSPSHRVVPERSSGPGSGVTVAGSSDPCRRAHEWILTILATDGTPLLFSTNSM